MNDGKEYLLAYQLGLVAGRQDERNQVYVTLDELIRRAEGAQQHEGCWTKKQADAVESTLAVVRYLVAYPDDLHLIGEAWYLEAQ